MITDFVGIDILYGKCQGDMALHAGAFFSQIRIWLKFCLLILDWALTAYNSPHPDSVSAEF